MRNTPAPLTPQPSPGSPVMPDVPGPAAPPASLVDKILKGDLPASLVVFLIAIPLSLGIAVASGAPIMAGLIAAVVGGIVVGALGGSQFQVSGPAAGLTVIVFGIVQQFGWPTTCAIVVLAGLLQIAFGVLKIARGALAISPAVVHGMLAGIGITIALAQLHIILGDKPEASALQNIRALPGEIATLHGPATFIGLLTVGLLFAWKYLPKPVQKVPGALAAIVISTVTAAAFRLNVERVDLPANLYADHVLPQIPNGNWGAVAVAAATVAVIASVESLLSAVAVDKMHQGDRANLDRELIGQGAGNTLSGLLGGLPVTGVIVRSSANVNAGAQTRASGIMHGIWILLFVALLGNLIEQIPLAALAGLLVYVGVQLVKPHDIRELTHHGEVLIYWVTVAGVVGLNLLYGVGIGIALAFIMLLRRMTRVKIITEQKDDRWHVAVDGTLSFLSVPQLTKALSEVPTSARQVDIDLRVDYMDHAAFEALHNWRVTQEKFGSKVDIDESHEDWYATAAAGTPRQVRGNTTDGRGMRSLLLGRRRVQGAAIAGSNFTNDPLMDGAIEFQMQSASVVRPVLSALARDGQEPYALFIACSDSRVVPELFTHSGPGDLFKIRNIGNLIPAYVPDSPGKTEGGDTSVSAALDYSLDVLQVPRIVVCGHSGCGAMKAVLDGADLSDKPHLHNWLAHGQSSLRQFEAGHVPDATLAPADQLSQVNVIEQVRHLMTYPKVQARVANGSLSVVGMYFDIENARVSLLDAETGRFNPVTDDEALHSESRRVPVTV